MHLHKNTREPHIRSIHFKSEAVGMDKDAGTDRTVWVRMDARRSWRSQAAMLGA